MSSHSPPRTLAELKARILSGEVVLSKMLEKAARSAFDAPDLVAFETGNAFAKRIGVSPQAVDRLARHLGFRNFREFRGIFRAYLTELAERAG